MANCDSTISGNNQVSTVQNLKIVAFSIARSTNVTSFNFPLIPHHVATRTSLRPQPQHAHAIDKRLIDDPSGLQHHQREGGRAVDGRFSHVVVFAAARGGALPFLTTAVKMMPDLQFFPGALQIPNPVRAPKTEGRASFPSPLPRRRRCSPPLQSVARR